MKIKDVVLLLVILFTVAGNFTLDRLTAIPINMEVKWIILALIIVLLPGLKWVKNDRSSNILLLLIFIFLWITSLTAIYSPDAASAYHVILDHIVILSMVILTQWSINAYSNKDQALDLIVKSFIGVAFVYCILIVITSVVFAGRGALLIGGPNVATRIIFFGSILSLYKFKNTAKMLYVYLFAFYIIGIILVGSRGGFVSGGLGLGLVLIMQFFNRKERNGKLFKKFVVGIAVLIGVVVVPLYDVIAKVFQERIINLLFVERYTAGRDVLYGSAVDNVQMDPLFGQGLGSYYQTLGIYPHNIFLEVLLNSGAVGMCIFLPLIIYSIVLLYKNRNTAYSYLCILPIYMIVVSNFSGSMFDFRYYFFWIIVITQMMDKPKGECKGIEIAKS